MITGGSRHSRTTIICFVLLLGLALSPVVVAEEEFTDVYRLGRAATRFSPDSAVEFEDFQRQFADYRADFEKVLAIAGWDGNTDALFAAVRDAKEGEDGAVRFVNAEPGTVLQWMALRRKGEPAIIENVRWAAKVPFPAWEITVEDGERRTIFVVPQWCMNLALDREEKVEKKVVAPVAPPPPPPPPSPECELSAMVDEEGMLTIDASASKGEVEVTGLTLPDGSAADLAMMQSAGDGKWTFDTSDYVGRKPGDYSFSVAAVSKLSGKEAACDVSTMVTRTGPAHRWIARGFGGPVSSDAENFRWSNTVQPNNFEEREMLGVESGTGFGLGLEYLVTDNWGVDFRMLYADFEGHWMYDLEEIWLMDEADIDYFPITIGMNYHFTPFSVVDIYAGAFIGYANVGSITFEDGELERRVSYDSGFTYGALLGLDIPFGDSPWVFTGAVSYSALELESDPIDGNEIEFDVNPLTTVIGIGYKF